MMTALLASGYGVMFTVLDDFRDEYGIAAHWLGLIVGMGFLAGFLSQVFIAPIADRGHARHMVMLGMMLNVVGLLGMAAGETLGVLLIARFISGIGMGMAVPAVRRIVVNEDPANLGSNLGLLLAADVTGFAAGPAISALLVPSFGIPAPFLVIAGATVLCLPVMWRVRVTEATEAPPRRFAFDLLGERPMIAGLMMGAAVFLMIGTFDALWAIVLDDLDASEWVANIGITLFALPLIFLSSWGGRLAQRVGPFRLGPLGLLLGACFMFSYGLLPTGMAMFCIGIFHGISDGITVSSTGVAVAARSATTSSGKRPGDARCRRNAHGWADRGARRCAVHARRADVGLHRVRGGDGGAGRGCVRLGRAGVPQPADTASGRRDRERSGISRDRPRLTIVAACRWNQASMPSIGSVVT